MAPWSPSKFNVLATSPLENESGLVGRWCVDGTGYDWSGNQRNGTLIGGPTTGPGIVGQGLLLNGSTQYVNVGSLADLNYVSPVTFTGWVYINSLTPAYSGIFCSDVLGGNFYWNCYITSSGQLACYVNYLGSNSAYQNTGAVLETGIWYHVAYVVSSAGLIGYVNGVQSATAGGVGVQLVAASGANNFIGNDPSSAGREFGGLINDARVYARVLSPGEIDAIYHQALSYQQGSPEGEMGALFLQAPTTITGASVTTTATYLAQPTTITGAYVGAQGNLFWTLIPLLGTTSASGAGQFVIPPTIPIPLIGEQMFLSLGAANVQAIALSPYIDGGFIDIYGDPSYVGTPENITISAPLATFNIGVPFAASISGGMITANPIPSTTVTNSGYASWFRVTQSDHLTVVFDGTIGTGGADLNFQNLVFVAGTPLAILAFVYTVPGV